MLPSSPSRITSRSMLHALGATLLAGAICVSAAHAASGTLVISQAYGGGGNSGSTYRNDFIEIFNRGTVAVDVAGWSVQYGSPAGSAWSVTPLSGVIPPGGYYLVREAQGAGGTVDLPTPDATGSTAMNAVSGKVALVNSTTELSGACPTDPSIVDLLGYGSANCSETSSTPNLSNTVAAIRDLGGCVDTDVNSADFSVSAPTPRNSASPASACFHSLEVLVDPIAGGTVTRTPDQPLYPAGSSVDLFADASPGYIFVGWSGDASGSNPNVTVVMDADKSVTALFAKPDVSHPIVISQIYGGGGNSGADYRNDFVELYNRGPETVDVTGWTMQYAAADGSSWTSTTLVGSIPPGYHYLVQEAQGLGGSLDLPTPDAIGTVEIHAVSGKVALVEGIVLLDGACPTDPRIQDFVGYGTATCSEGEAFEALDNLTAAMREENGCGDTGDNLPDFGLAVPNPRNLATAPYYCQFWLDAGGAATRELELGLPAPNPSRGALRVDFALPRETAVRLTVHDLQGRVVARLADGTYSAGRHHVAWDGRTSSGPVRSGVYFVRLHAPQRTLVRSVIVTQ